MSVLSLSVPLEMSRVFVCFCWVDFFVVEDSLPHTIHVWNIYIYLHTFTRLLHKKTTIHVGKYANVP